MTAKITCFPVGTADSSRIDLTSGKKMLVDYAHYYNPDNPGDPRIDLASELSNDLRSAGRDYFDVGAFTHLDDDHIHGFSDFFWLEFAAKYQGKDRIKIKELWVPAAAITEEGLTGEARTLRDEARYRLKEGAGIRVFSRPGHLKAWLEKEGLTLESRQHLITDAGQLVPGFSLNGPDQAEFFIHSPFAWRLDDTTVVDRNDCSLCFQAVFKEGNQLTRALFMADTTHGMLDEMVKTTRRHKRDDRFEWDIYKTPHHCSYLSISPEKGEDQTEPTDSVRWVLEDKRRSGCLVISSCEPIPVKGSDEDKDQNPPHREAHNYYKKVADEGDGEIRVTMQFPNKIRPKPTVITIDSFGATLVKAVPAAAAAVAAAPARAGSR